MLVLTRKKKQSLMLGDEIEVQILEIHGEQVRVGIVAPPNVRILRKEIYMDIRTQNQAAVVDKPLWHWPAPPSGVAEKKN